MFTGEATGDQVGEFLSRAGGGEGASFLIGVPQHDVSGRSNVGAIYLVSASDLAILDAADGRLDRVIGLENVVYGANSWKLVGEAGLDRAGRSLVSTGDMDGDGHTDVLIGAPHHGTQSGAAYFVSGTDLAVADTADGFRDHTVRLIHVASQPGSWKFVGENDYDQAGISVASVPDTDGDGKAELLIGAWAHNPGARPMAGAAYFMTSSDLASADQADGTTDGLIDLGHAADQAASWKFTGETSGDRAGSPVAAPGDVDGDGNAEISIHARFARQAGDSSSGAVYLISVTDLAAADDADGQRDHVIGLGRVAGQPGSWKLRNGYTNVWSQQPLEIAYGEFGSISWLVTGRDVFSASDLLSTDTADGSTDGVVDLDRLIGQPNSWKLRTNPGALVGDTDGDGTPDELDPFQLDPSEWADSDHDRLGDNADAFPFDPREQVDTDGDGLGNRYADDDDDGDGIADSEDAFPFDASRSDLTSTRLDLGLPGDDFDDFGIAAAGDLDGGGAGRCSRRSLRTWMETDRSSSRWVRRTSGTAIRPAPYRFFRPTRCRCWTPSMAVWTERYRWLRAKVMSFGG